MILDAATGDVLYPDLCVYLGEGCPEEALFLSNWRTGELRPVDEP
jgi:hypothetical protein